ncbi:hypothetical protein F4810DRAFT_677742 [Camillea tinctor]|nr:hypothetical protein F4810DRAFT_677742 [Camillea tinctor]
MSSVPESRYSYISDSYSKPSPPFFGCSSAWTPQRSLLDAMRINKNVRCHLPPTPFLVPSPPLPSPSCGQDISRGLFFVLFLFGLSFYRLPRPRPCLLFLFLQLNIVWSIFFRK